MACYRCGEPVDADTTYCPECGLHLAAVYETVQAGTCPKCEVDFEAGACPECGTDAETLRAEIPDGYDGTEPTDGEAAGADGNDDFGVGSDAPGSDGVAAGEDPTGAGGGGPGTAQSQGTPPGGQPPRDAPAGGGQAAGQPAPGAAHPQGGHGGQQGHGQAPPGPGQPAGGAPGTAQPQGAPPAGQYPQGQGLAQGEAYCVDCGAIISDRAETCPACGAYQFAQGGYGANAGYAGGGGAQPRAPVDGPVHELVSTAQVWAGIRGAVYATFVGFAVTTFLFLMSIQNAIGQLPRIIQSIPAVSAAAAGGAAIGSPVAAIAKFFVWIYFNANFVSVTASGTAGDTSRTVSSNAVTQIGAVTSLEPLLFHLTPIVLLVVFGYFAAKSWGYRQLHENAAAGASVAIGYALVGGLGAMFSSIGFGGSFGPTASVGPPLVLSVAIFAGIGLVCGAVGGVLRHAKRNGQL